ncbi:hypothetical protein [Alysiella filiformis]|uniref:hypothetical protein n=1 Tax=Alysiella filiformis TaxID=194196 RepID=UPI000BE315C4|nr:hypothetical protein [Alysiella filiformis]
MTKSPKLVTVWGILVFRQLFCGFFITLQKRELGISNCECANKPALSPCGRELERGFVEAYPLPSPLPQGEGEKLFKFINYFYPKLALFLNELTLN